MTTPRYVIQREWATTECENPHPVRLGRNAEHQHGEPWERRSAIDSGAKGYLCPGAMEHDYPIWVVFNAADDRESNAGVFDVYTDAVACRDRMNAAAKATVSS